MHVEDYYTVVQVLFGTLMQVIKVKQYAFINYIYTLTGEKYNNLVV